MRVRIFTQGNSGFIDRGLITDYDIMALDGQKVIFDEKEFIVQATEFKMTSSGENISVEKQIYLLDIGVI